MMRSWAYCALLSLFSVNIVLHLSSKKPGGGRVAAADELSLNHHRTSQQVSEAVRRLRGQVSGIRDRETADMAWAKITELNEWLGKQHRVKSVDVASGREEPGSSVAVERRPREDVGGILDASTILLVICYERYEALSKCLASVLRHHPCGGSRVLVSQDGTSRANEAIEREVREFKKALESRCGEQLVEFRRNERQTNSGTGYHKLSRHFQFALGEAFRLPGVERTIILEEDLVIASDFFHLFAGLAPILDSDETLLAASAWNDNGQRGRVRNAQRIVRSDFFPGLGWMLTSRIWKELEPKWPAAYWDDWLREPQQRKGRHILRPEMCRTYHQTSTGGTSNNQYSQFLTNTRLYDGLPVEFSSSNFKKQLADELRLDKYDSRLRDDLRLASHLPLSSLSGTHGNLVIGDVAAGLSPGGGAVRVEYDGLDDRRPDAFPALARKLGIMDNIKAGVPRTAYRGVVDFWQGEFHVYLSPPLERVESNLFRLSTS